MNIQKSDQKKDIRALINSDAVKNQIAMVLPKHMSADRMARVAITAILKTPKLMDCRPESLLQALMLCSQTGLEPDGRNAHLIPYGDIVQVIFDWKGLVALAERNGVKNIRAVSVCEEDTFDFQILNGRPTVTHVINWKKPRGKAYVYYGTCLRNDELDVEVMHKDEIDAIRKRSKASGSGPWVTDFDEMAKKTVLRRMSKRWDIAPEVADGLNQDFDSPPEINKRPAAPVVLSPLQLSETKEDDGDFGPTATETPAASTSNTVSPEPQSADKTAATGDSPAAVLAAIKLLCQRDGVTEAQLLKYLYETKFADAAKHHNLSELATSKLQRIGAKWDDMVEKVKGVAA